MITIIGDYDRVNKKLIIVILSKKKFANSIVYINNIESSQMDILKNDVTRVILDLDSFQINNLTIKIMCGSKLIELIKNLNLSNIFESVKIVNCDSTLGLEKNLWEKIEDSKSQYIIHCGDQIYNDKIFKKYYRFYNLDKSNKKKLKKEIFNNYYYQFERYKNILKNNLNLMIPDDHEIIDDAYESKHGNNEKFKIIFNIFNKFVKNIELALKFSNDDIYYLTDDINKTIYVLNYEIEFNNKILDKYNFDNKIDPFDNVILISRKSLLSTKNNIGNQLIFSNDKMTLVDIDSLIKKILKTNKNFYIFCGDDHSYKKSIITYKNRIICKIITCGSINTVPEIFKNEIILNTKINGICIKNKSYELVNNFIEVENRNNKVVIKNISENKNILFYMIDNIINVCKLI
jgi:hypothetical protein